MPLPHLAVQQCGGPPSRIVAGVLQGALDQGELGDVTVRVPFDQARQGQEHVGPERPAGQLLGHRFEERSRTAQLASLPEDRGGLDRPSRPAVEIVFGNAADRGDIELARCGGRATGPSCRGRCVKKLGDLRIRVRPGEREMVCPGFHVRRNLGEAKVPVASLVRARQRVGSCSQQRVTELDAFLSDTDQAGFDCGVKQRFRRRPERGLHERRRRLRGGRRHEERVARSLWQPGEPVREQVAEARTEREGLTGRPLVAPSIHRAGDLEREERVAAGGLVDAPHERPRERVTRPVAEDLMDCSGAQRSDRQVPRRFTKCAPEIQLSVAVALRSGFNGLSSPRRENSHVGVAQATQDVFDDEHGCLVKPLGVVDGEYNGSIRRQLAQGAQHTGRKCPLIGRRTVTLEQQHDFDRPALRLRQTRQDLPDVLDEQVGQAAVQQVDLGACRSAREHAMAEGASLLHACPPDGGLARAGRTLDQQRLRPGTRLRQEPVDHREFLLPANEVVVPPLHQRHHRPPDVRRKHVWVATVSCRSAAP